MSDYKKRNHRKFDIDARGIRTSWAKIDRLYDGNNRLPNDSEQFGRQVLDYVASLISDVEGASLSALRNFDSDLIRTGDGYGNKDWVLNDEYSPAVVAAYAPLVRYLTGTADNNFFDTNGGLRPGRFKNEYNIVVTDSDGVMSTKNIYTMLKLNFDDWLGLDFFARNKIAKRVTEGYEEDSELATSLADSVKKVFGDSTDPMRIKGDLTVDGSTTLNGDLILGDAAADSLVVNATTDFTNGVDLNGDVNLGNSTADNITITGRIDSNIIPDADNTYDLGATGLEWRNAYFDGTVQTDFLQVDNNATITGNATVNGNSTLGNAASDTLTVNATSNFGSSVTIAGATTLNGAVTLGDAASDIITVNGTMSFNGLTATEVAYAGAGGNITGDGNFTWNGTTLSLTGTVTVAGQGNFDNIRLDGNTISTTTGGLTINSAGTLTVSDATSFSSTVTTSGNVNVNNKFGVTASTGVVQTDSLAGTGVRNVSVDAAGNLTTSNPTAQVALIIYNSAGGVLKTIYGNAV